MTEPNPYKKKTWDELVALQRAMKANDPSNWDALRRLHRAMKRHSVKAKQHLSYKEWLGELRFKKALHRLEQHDA